MVYPADWEKVTCRDWYDDEKKIWLCLEDKNAICEIDKGSKALKVLGSFPHNGLSERDLSLSVERYEDYIVFCPFRANDIAVLNIFTEKLEFIDLSDVLVENIHMCAGTEKFYRMVSFKNHIYFFGIKYPAIMRFDLITRKIELFNEWLEIIERYKCKNAVLFTDGYALKEDEIYIPIGRCNGVLRVNLSTMEWKFIEIKPVNNGILGMTQKENIVWLTEYDVAAEKFFQWNLNNDEIIQINLPCQDAFYAPLYCDNTLLFFQNFGKRSYQYDLETGEWTELTNILPDLEYSSDKKFHDNVINYFANRSKRLYRWDIKRNMVSYDEIRIKDKGFLKKSWEDYCKPFRQELEEQIIKEGRMTLRDYIEIISTV